MSKQKALQLLEARKKAEKILKTYVRVSVQNGYEVWSSIPEETGSFLISKHGHATFDNDNAHFYSSAANEIESVVNWALTLENQLEVAKAALNEIITHVGSHPDGLDGRFVETKSTVCALKAIEEITIDSIKRGE